MKTYSQTISLSGRRKKKLEKQVEKCLIALKDNRNDPKLHIELGDSYAQLEEVGNSVKCYYAAIELLRQTPGPGKLRNLIVDLYEKIIAIAPNEYKVYVALSEEYIAAGQKERALRFLLSSAKKAYESENYELALQCYTQAIAKGRTNPHIVERCTELYIKLGRKDDAMKNYIEIGDMYAQEEKNIEALEYYKKACALDKDNPELILKIARMYNAMAWTENAASELVRVGEYYEKQREFTEALRYYHYSVRLDPENEKAQDGKKRITEMHGADGIPLADMEDGREEEVPDVLEELERIEDSVEEDRTRTGEFEITPIDEDATLTLEDSKDSEVNFDQATQLEPEHLFMDQGEILDFNEDKSPTIDFGQPTQAEPEIMPMDLDLDTILAFEGGQSSEEVSPGEQGSGAAFNISLEDWIIDLKEEELVELALEEALKDQEMASTGAFSVPVLSIAGMVEERPDQENSLFPVPAIAAPAEEDWMDTQTDQTTVPAETAVLEEEQAEREDQETSEEPFLQVDLDQTADKRIPAQEEHVTVPAETDVTQHLDMYLKEEHGETGDQESSEPFMQVDVDQAESTPVEEEELMFRVNLPEDSFQEFTDKNNGKGPVLSEVEESAVEESETKEPEVEESEVEEQPEQQQGDEEIAFEFPEDTPETEEQPEEAQAKEEIAFEFQEDTPEVEEHLEQEQSEEEPVVGFQEDITAIEEQSDQGRAETEEVISFLEDTAEIEEELDQVRAEAEEVVGFLEDTAKVKGQFDQSVTNNIIELRRKIDDLEQRLQRTEEEKYFLQERFAAQISHHKAHEETLQKEITEVYKDKEELEKRLQQGSAVPLTGLPSRKGHEKFDEARYEALVSKIQSKKVLLQQHIDKLLKKRQENGIFLTGELNTLNATKQRLQHSLEYFQQIRGRIEEKINMELLQAKMEIQALSETTSDLENKLRAQQLVEQNLRKQFETLNKEKEMLQENYTKSIDSLTRDKTDLEQQVQEASQAKKAVERILRNKLQDLNQSYQRLKVEYKTALDSKEAQIHESAQQLSEFADKYVKLERTLAEIRKERDKLNTMLTQETSTREILEEKLIGIESQVDSLEVHGSKLLSQLGQELDRHFEIEQSVSDKFQLSLEELEGLLVLQEKEIQNLEVL